VSGLDRIERVVALVNVAVTLLLLVYVALHVVDPPSLPDFERPAWAEPRPSEEATNAVQDLRIDTLARDLARAERDFDKLRTWMEAEVTAIRAEHGWLAKLLMGNLVTLLASTVTYIVTNRLRHKDATAAARRKRWRDEDD
jgi:hypothetical protein